MASKLYSMTPKEIVAELDKYIISHVKPGGNYMDIPPDVKSVRILWESFGSYVKPAALELISATCKDGDYAVFEVAQNFQEGNAADVSCRRNDVVAQNQVKNGQHDERRNAHGV